MSTDSTIKVFLKDVAGMLTEIDIASDGTVLNLKEKYSELHTGITVAQQKLVITSSIDGQVPRIALQDHLSISSYNITSDGIGSQSRPILVFVFNQM
uniref:Ubiquitin-like domain-containing protein n=1 Tax=viral metagenome TaxID=1070528 RepID=A0A6C0DDV4_9ZZZZ